jgi:hypothetical protein
MAGKAKSRVEQMVAVADARTRRAADAAAAAQQAVDAAIAETQTAIAERLNRQAQLNDAQRQLTQKPGSEQHRLWLERCRQSLIESEARLAEAEETEEHCKAMLEQAKAFWQRQQYRQDHLVDHANMVARNAAKLAERRQEDEQQGQGRATSPRAVAI